jgi:hypothetical protein
MSFFRKTQVNAITYDVDWIWISENFGIAGAIFRDLKEHIFLENAA